MNVFWTLYIILTVADSDKAKNIEIESFKNRMQCEESIMTRVVQVDDKYKFEFKCLKTDESVK